MVSLREGEIPGSLVFETDVSTDTAQERRHLYPDVSVQGVSLDYPVVTGELRYSERGYLGNHTESWT